jgi:hypothetical protein
VADFGGNKPIARGDIVDVIEGLLRDLVEIGRTVKDPSYHNSGYLYKDERGEHTRDPRAREIGARLDRLGGKALMLQAHAVVREELGSTAARGLEACWGEIGEWLA